MKKERHDVFVSNTVFSKGLWDIETHPLRGARRDEVDMPGVRRRRGWEWSPARLPFGA